jgi:hypothetical protein
MPSSPSLPRRGKTGRSGCVPDSSPTRPSSSFTFFLCLQKELKKLAKVHGSAVPPSAGTPLPSTPATTVPTQPPAPPPRMSTPTPVPRGVKREFEDSSLAQPSGPIPTTFSSSGGVSPTSSQVQRPVAAKAGVPGARPRPVKKQRVVSYDFTLLSAAQSSGDLPVAVPILASHPSSLRVANLYLPVTNRTCKAKRETCIRIRQYNSLLHRVCDVVQGCNYPYLKWYIMICYLTHWQAATRRKCATKPRAMSLQPVIVRMRARMLSI